MIFPLFSIRSKVGRHDGICLLCLLIVVHSVSVISAFAFTTNGPHNLGVGNGPIHNRSFGKRIRGMMESSFATPKRANDEGPSGDDDDDGDDDGQASSSLSPLAEDDVQEIPLEVDIAIVGAGLGGLCAGAILNTLYNKRVAVFESHYLAGGCAHAFERKAKNGETFTFDSGPTILLGCVRN